MEYTPAKYIFLVPLMKTLRRPKDTFARRQFGTEFIPQNLIPVNLTTSGPEGRTHLIPVKLLPSQWQSSSKPLEGAYQEFVGHVSARWARNLQGLRRALPLTRQKLDWDKVRPSLLDLMW